MARKTHILFVGSFVEAGRSGNVGGQWYACRTLLRSPLSNDVKWILLDTTAPSNYHIPVWRRGLRAMVRMTRFFFILLFRKVDSVLLFTSNGNSFREKGTMALLAKSFGKRVVIAPRAGRLLNELQDEAKRTFIGKVFRASDAVICQSDGWRKSFESAFPQLSPERWVVIRNWIDLNELPSPQRPKPEGKVAIGFIGAIEQPKGIFDLVDACTIISRETTNFTVLMGGNGKDREEMESRIAANGLSSFFTFKGWVTGEAKYQLLQQSDIFVLPSYFEGSPNSLKEAMGSGIASIGTTVGAMPEIIDEGVNGYIIAPGDVDALAQRLLTLIRDPELRTQFGDRGIEKIRKAHTIEAAAEAFRAILTKPDPEQ